MKTLVTFISFLFLLITSQAQTPSLQWVRNFGSGFNDYCTSVSIDHLGNTITTGVFADTIDFDPGPAVLNLASHGHFDFFVIKLDPAGNLLWAISFGNNRADMSNGVQTDQMGNVYVSGFFSGTVDFDPGAGVANLSTTDPNSPESFLLKLDTDGNYIWARNFLNINIAAIDADVNGNVYATGGFTGIADFDPGPGVNQLTEYSYTGYATGVQDVFVLKLDASGTFQWARQLGGVKSDLAESIAVDASGNIITTGTFSATADFNPGPGTAPLTSAGFRDVFICKLDPNGNYVWSKQVGGLEEDFGRDITVDAAENIYLCGEFSAICDFDPGPGTYNLTSVTLQKDVFILKLNSAGGFLWAKQMKGKSDDLCKSITLDRQGNVYTTGYFQSNCDFDPGAGTFLMDANGYEDVFISKLDNDGNFVWAVSMGSVINTDAGFDLKVDHSGNVYTVGNFWGTVDFDPGPGVYNLTMVDYGDAFIQKLNQCPDVTYAVLNITACNSYTLNNQVYNKSGTYKQTLLNVAGCDSLITLNLHIGGSDTTITATSCDHYLWEGSIYSQSGTYTVTYTSSNGCDSIRRLLLTIKNSITTHIDTSICQGQSYSGYTSPGVYSDTYTAASGCDSVRILHLDVKHKSVSTIQATICEGEMYAGHTNSGTYTDIFVAANGCDSIRTLYLTVNPKKTTTLQVTICEGKTYTAGGVVQTVTGTYRDTLQSYSGCDSIIITNLTVHPKPKPQLGQDQNICFGSVLLLNPGSFSTYKWQDASTTPAFTATTAGWYWVTVTNNFNCTATDSIQVTGILPSPAHFLKLTDSVCPYEKLVLRPTVVFDSYEWSTGARQNNITVNTPGQYWLKVADKNGCSGMDTITVLSKQCITGVFIPSAFTPNGDRKNDAFKAIIYGRVKAFKLQVFDRLGQLVFQTEDPAASWDGQYKGMLYPVTTFVWQCFYQLEGEPPGYQKGTVLLIK